MSVKRLLLKQSAKAGGGGGGVPLPIGLIFVWAGTLASIPAGFSLCDGAGGTPDLRSKFVEAVPNAATNPGATGGAATHNHTGFSTVTHLATEHGGLYLHTTGGIYSHKSGVDASHSHTNIVGEGTEPAYYEIAYIMVTGVVTQLPDGIIGIWTDILANIPVNWNLTDGVGGRPNLLDRFLKGSAAGINPGGTGGSNATHTHTTNTAGSHTHEAPCVNSGVTEYVWWGYAGAHTHPLSADLSLPKYYQVAFIQRSGAGIAPTGLIVMWSGLLANIPAGWALCDGLGGRPNLLDRFVKCVPDTITNPGATGGADTHNHTGATGIAGWHWHTQSTGAYHSTYWTIVNSGAYASPSHTFNAGDNHPPFYQIAFIIKT